MRSKTVTEYVRNGIKPLRNTFHSGHTTVTNQSHAVQLNVLHMQREREREFFIIVTSTLTYTMY